MSALRFPDPPLSDGVVSLRAFQDGDAAVAAAWCEDADIMRWSGAPPDPTEKTALAWAALTDIDHDGGVLALAVADAASGVVLGSCDVRRPAAWDPELGEVGFLLGPEARGRGIATRSVRLLLAYAFRTLGMARVQAFAHPHNSASAKVLERLGFHREGLLRDYRPGEQGREDRILFSLLRCESRLHDPSGGEMWRTPAEPHDASTRQRV
jgi:RimJ/RimL family protein N-acetyltransferase